MQVLKMVEAGQIGADEAAELLASLEQPPPEEEPAPAGRLGTPVPAGEPAAVPENRWARFWIFPLMVGGIVLILGALVMGLAYAAGSVAGWLLCGWPLLLLGFLAVILALWSRSATWIHVRVKEEGGRRVALSLPVPLTLAAWVLRMAQPYVPQLQDTGVDEVIIALRDSASEGQPLFIDVKDDEKGEHVQVYIG